MPDVLRADVAKITDLTRLVGCRQDVQSTGAACRDECQIRRQSRSLKIRSLDLIGTHIKSCFASLRLDVVRKLNIYTDNFTTACVPPTIQYLTPNCPFTRKHSMGADVAIGREYRNLVLEEPLSTISVKQPAFDPSRLIVACVSRHRDAQVILIPFSRTPSLARDCGSGPVFHSRRVKKNAKHPDTQVPDNGASEVCL